VKGHVKIMGYRYSLTLADIEGIVSEWAHDVFSSGAVNSHGLFGIWLKLRGTLLKQMSQVLFSPFTPSQDSFDTIAKFRKELEAVEEELDMWDEKRDHMRDCEGC
jgi:hypothetical protein